MAHTVVAVGGSSCSPPPHMVPLACGGMSKQEVEGTTRSEAALPGLIVTPISEAGHYTCYELSHSINTFSSPVRLIGCNLTLFPFKLKEKTNQ